MKTTLLLSVLCAVMAVAASASCGTETCANDEYCNNSTACQCNTTLYKNAGSLPSSNFTCNGANFNIQVSKCWLEAHGYNTSNVRLNSTTSNCWAAREVVNGISEMTLHRPLITSDCNTEAVMNATHVTYTNQLYMLAKTKPIQTINYAVMNVSCSYALRLNASLNMTLHPILGITIIPSSIANGTYTVYMVAYTDNTYVTPLTESSPLYVEDTIYISVFIPDLTANAYNLKVVNLYASPDNSSSLQYYLLQNECPASGVGAGLLTVNNNGAGLEARFAMKVFQIANSNNVYLFADVAICVGSCNLTCSSQSKSGDSQDIAGRVGLFLNAADGAFEISSASSSSMPWTLSALIFSWILMKLM
ncbi:uromodulin-like [Rana temporaria]|uniref:uromodulin-like n=1 Tax=Rana temporaria TaxID=8407 RepID=UPI001AAC9B19|nr:uromodulin-like [Rana temporaria]